MARFDILMALHNRADYVASSIKSIVDQSFKDWHLIIADHASTDQSLEIASSYADRDSRITVTQVPANLSLSEVRNHTLSLSSGEFVAIQDSDDLSRPNRLERTIKAFELNPEIDALGGQAMIIDGNDLKIGSLRAPTDAETCRVESIFQNPTIHPTVAIRRGAVDKWGATYGRSFLSDSTGESLHVDSLAEDYLLLGQFCVLGRYLNIEDVLVDYRKHSGSISISKFSDQIVSSLKVARYLARVSAKSQGVDTFDPAIFCMHGGILLDGDLGAGPSNLSVEKALLRGNKPSDALHRKLAYCEVIRDRRLTTMAYRYAVFAQSRGVLEAEWYPVKHWLTKSIRRSVRVTATLES